MTAPPSPFFSKFRRIVTLTATIRRDFGMGVV
jgi:hypothetical protein